MEKGKKYPHVKFSADTVKAGIESFLSLDGVNKDKLSINWKIHRGAESWRFDTEEEFFADYRAGFSYARCSISDSAHGYEMSVTYGFSQVTEVSVRAPSRPELERVFWPFERDAPSATIERDTSPAPEIPKPVVFIGHGRSSAWRDLKDHLVEQHGYVVQAYETGARSGHTIRDILDEMLTGSSFALLVLSGEDETELGEMRARQNVVHELGLFQGKLGFPRAIAVVEENIELFSNMDGVQQIRFAKDEVRQTYGDVLATLRREFGDAR
ncbi:nucleotide-binding protein [Streptomyces hokutonensis]|uniref:nucleotide-binding protein n=1 Tax=Streptomyces hokutonensis TaxID=1306990 RepID=UPI000996D15A|nr:nucleotide-binding protein [Streptomyces hokutonensis]